VKYCGCKELKSV